MRVSKRTQQETRERLLKTAARLFASTGFDATLTRDIAREAGVAAGTLFNYFPSKEDLVTALMADALERAETDFEKRSAAPSLAEDLFGHIACGLRRLKAHRTYLRPALETALSPLRASRGNETADGLRTTHLQTVERVLARHGIEPPGTLSLQMYWTLYTGVLAYWSEDGSPRQEDTLALLDGSTQMFASWLTAQPTTTPDE